MNILVTGGAGFIGSHIVDALLQENHSVRVYDNLSTGKLDNLNHEKVELVVSDLACQNCVTNACKDIEIVFHQAALSSVQLSIKNPIKAQESGEIGTVCLLNACVKNKVKRVIFAASASVYGDTGEKKATETMLPLPMSPYAVSKLACEGYMKAFSQCYGLDTVCLRYFNVFGQRQLCSDYSGVITKFTEIMKHSNPIVYGDGEQTRDFVHVNNVIHANLLAMKYKGRLEGEVFNVATGRNISVNRLVDCINETRGTTRKAKHEEPRIEIRHSCGDIKKIEECLGYSIVTPFEVGLADFVKNSDSC